MPRWEAHSRNWFRDRSRYDLRRRLGEILTGVVPGITVDRWWQAEYLDRSFGGVGQSWDQQVWGDPNIAASYHTVALHNPIPTTGDAVECLIYRVVATFATGSGANPGAGPILFHPLSWVAATTTSVNLFTVGEQYFDNSNPSFVFTPSLVNGIGVRLGWQQMGVGPGLNDLVLPTAHFDCGVHNTPPVVSVGGLPQYSTGPLLPTLPTGGGVTFEGSFTPGDSPPLRLKPGQRLVVQTHDLVDGASSNLFTTSQRALFASFWWVERIWREPVG